MPSGSPAEPRHRLRRRRATGSLRTRILAARRQLGCTLDDLTVLSNGRDPYRKDTPAGHRDAKWFAAQLTRFVSHRWVHLRGLHYRIVVAGDVSKPTDRQVYASVEVDWIYLQKDAAKCARWLEYVPFSQIKDERNDEPKVYRDPLITEGDEKLTLGVGNGHALDVEFRLEDLLPRLHKRGGRTHVQPFQIALIGEKSSLASELDRIAARVSGEMLLPTGEATDTMIAELLNRAIEDGRPLAILYFSDFDPSGRQMPTSVARKVQAMLDLWDSDLHVQLFPVALTIEQVREHDLPSTPLSEKELRGDSWRAAFGREQTEIDALAALRPDILRAIVEDAITAFYDATLEDRAEEVTADWFDTAQERFAHYPEYAEARTEIETAYRKVQAAVDELTETQERWAERLAQAVTDDPDHEDAPEDDVEPELADAPEPLFTTDDDWITATQKLIDYKRLIDVGGAP
jgi:hypothetical protein